MNMGIFYAVLIFVGVCVGIALTWFLVELIITLRKTRKKVDEVQKQLAPTIQNVEQITTKIQPAIEKVDPLIERVSLTIDATNLELMRADQILENVNTVAEAAASATTAVGNIASAPADLISKAGKKIQSLISGESANDNIAGELGAGDTDIDQIIQQSNNPGKHFKKVKKIGQQNQMPDNSPGNGNPFVSIN